jgi:hypothetical protein
MKQRQIELLVLDKSPKRPEMDLIKEDGEWNDLDSEKSAGVDAQSFKSAALKSLSKKNSRPKTVPMRRISLLFKRKPPRVRSVRVIEDPVHYE